MITEQLGLAEPDGLRAGLFLLRMQLLRLLLGHLGPRLLEPRLVPGLADPGEDLPLLLPDVLLEARADRLDLGEPPRLRRIQAVDLLDQRLDPLHLLLVLAAPGGELGVRLPLDAGERSVEAGVLDLLVRLELRLEVGPEIAALLGRGFQDLLDAGLRFLVL